MTTQSSATSPEPRKRPRVEVIADANDTPVASDTGSRTEEKPTPSYGSKEYWEDRYKKNSIADETGGEEDPEPYHAWYFKFDDLAPLLMPLILGGDVGDDNDDNDEVNKSKTDVDIENKNTKKETHNNTDDEKGAESLGGNDADLSSQQMNDERHQKKNSHLEHAKNSDDSGDESDDFEVIEMEDYDDDDDEDPVVRVGLAKNGPISILEVGCGDAPLGRDLALSIQEYGTSIEQDSASIVEKVVCSDYSKNVIEMMKEEQLKAELDRDAKEKSVQVHYEVADARQLSYPDGSFEMILEKGTLDAMLSDSEGGGQENCRKIVAECARVLKVSGYIIIISHLNARVESGLQWLNNVIVPGLRAAGDFHWLVEVHGSDVEVPSDDDDDAAEEKPIESPGPAVYFIEKVGATSPAKSSDGSEESLPTIPLKFFSY